VIHPACKEADTAHQQASAGRGEPGRGTQPFIDARQAEHLPFGRESFLGSVEHIIGRDVRLSPPGGQSDNNCYCFIGITVGIIFRFGLKIDEFTSFQINLFVIILNYT